MPNCGRLFTVVLDTGEEYLMRMKSSVPIKRSRMVVNGHSGLNCIYSARISIKINEFNELLKRVLVASVVIGKCAVCRVCVFYTWGNR